MKQFFIACLLLFFLCNLKATDPIRKKTFFLQGDLSYTFHHFYHQALFQKKGWTYGGAVSAGHRAFPVYMEYYYQSPMTFTYRNNEIKDQFQELGLRYNLNHLSYIIPHGLDPYVGVGLMMRKNRFTQYEITQEANPGILKDERQSTTFYKLSAGVRVGNQNVTLGFHYDYLPKGFQITNTEGISLPIYNATHLFSIRMGFRIHHIPGRRIKCPRLQKKQKRTLLF